jgi:hypothetical protein
MSTDRKVAVVVVETARLDMKTTVANSKGCCSTNKKVEDHRMPKTSSNWTMNWNCCSTNWSSGYYLATVVAACSKDCCSANRKVAEIVAEVAS